ncbi:hypothetical protein COW36_02985 [bacterium (Candidatus Blackallbacteria) CG17_big_fil_post_rev_8_21_14_2_50_48_46]|uniref:Lipoprotein n=1 Tax=bacterium (Candidatus Blackallbacteria) CG17_big_fil_post_rev_8_21_14_2_50_48_46 TaxID=2014261 RepID=A0A2M7GAC2_9BACT|nr:MAG: hypothetical protein COW64_12490 [bacterium (Candidatus Blackallbacteria) CG18_big_fil_WC_8_21_14_2_50_49_26]PIW19093.1 MAG: hypothetical protein COW36_02985 [bacterium (Candidatus Blackallbacteria) CG17_big_fil_post_rev_8_21_14_2_50_48_46]PIW44540.1 MAG: hypothetical protein COW20_23135 [bacterium (Candidatus Blackallbacteria) CG13_big_fil_rev_8_21_14_2_50_49_14]
MKKPSMFLLFSLLFLSCTSTPVKTELAANQPSTAPELEKGLSLNLPNDKTLPAQASDKRNKTVIQAKAITGKIKAPFKDKDLPIEISDYSFNVGTDTNKNGAEDEHGKGMVDISGHGKHAIEINQEDFPVMDNQDDVMVVVDKTTGNTRTYSADQDQFNYKISDGSNTLTINTNADGTWMVNGEGASTPAEVVKLALKSPVLSGASIHGLASLYMLMKNTNQIPVELNKATLSAVDCGGNGGTQLQAPIGNPLPLVQAGLEALIQQATAAN